MWGAGQFETARQAFKHLQPLFDMLSSISLSKALSIMRIWGSVQQLRGHPYPWGIDGNVIDYEDEANDEFFDLLRYFWIMALSTYPPATLEQYFGDQVRSDCLIEKHFPHVEILINHVCSDGLVPAHALCADHVNRRLVLVIRGSAEKTDWLINLSCKVQETECHSGFWRSGNVLLNSVQPTLTEFMETHPHYELHTAGHSLGAAIATITAMLLKSNFPQVRGWSFAPPKCFNKLLATECEPFVTSVCYGRDIIAHACFASANAILSVLDELGQENDFQLLGENFVLQSKSTIDSECVKSPLTTTSRTKTFDAMTLDELDMLLCRRINDFNHIFGFPLEIHGNNFLEVMVDSVKSTVKRNLLNSPPPKLTCAETRRMKDWHGFQSNPPSADPTSRHATAPDRTRASLDWLMTEVVKQMTENITPKTVEFNGSDSPISVALDSQSDGGLSQACTPNAQDQEEVDLESYINRFLRWSWPSNKPSEKVDTAGDETVSGSTVPSVENMAPSEHNIGQAPDMTDDDKASPPQVVDETEPHSPASPTRRDLDSSNSFLSTLVNKMAQGVLAILDPTGEDPVRHFINEMREVLMKKGEVDIGEVVKAHRLIIGREFEKLSANGVHKKEINLKCQHAAERLYDRIAERISNLTPRLYIAGRIIQIIPLEHFVCGDPFWHIDESSQPNLALCNQVWNLLAKCSTTNSFPAHVFVNVNGSEQSLFDPLYKISSVEDHMPLAYTRALVPDLRIF